MNRIDTHFEGIAERQYAVNQALDRFYAEAAEDEAEKIKRSLLAGEVAETATVADEFIGTATTAPAMVAAWAKGDTTTLLALMDAAMRTAVTELATVRAEKLNP
jgi:hypothetical protein